MFLNIARMQVWAWFMVFAFVGQSFFSDVLAAPKGKEWRQHRGGPELRGLASGKLGTKLNCHGPLKQGIFSNLPPS